MNRKSTTQLVLLGTGTPNAEPHRAGSAGAIIVNETPYLIDFGPGVIRRAAAAYQQGVQALAPQNLTTAFLTHLHSDHTAGYSDLILTPWVLGRDRPLQVFGPPGTVAMTDHLLAAYQADIQERLVGLEPANSTGYQVQAHDVGAGPIYEDDRVKVEGFSANHGSWPALSYRFITPAGVIVISGDTAPYEGIIDQYQGCDILVHEVYSETGWQGHSTPWQQYHARMHTSTGELASIANAVKPALLVLSHQLYWGQSEEGLLQEIKAHYRGAVVSAKDLDVFELDARTIVSAG